MDQNMLSTEQISQQLAQVASRLETVASESQKVTIFIDNTNLGLTIRKIDPNYQICYNKLAKHLANGRQIRQCRIYYSDIDPRGNMTHEEAAKRYSRDGFYNWLRQQGFWLKELTQTSRADGTMKEKGLDAAIIKDMERLLNSRTNDTVVLVAGDQDYREVILEAQSHHFTPVEVAFFPEFASRNLILAASKFVNLSESKESLRRS
jgi:uncharacterized LabA/DUF88 family protein